MTPEEQKEYRDGKLSHFVSTQLYPYSPFYRKMFDDNKVKPGDIRSVEDLRRLPFTYKADIAPTAEDTERFRRFVLEPDAELIKTYMPRLSQYRLSANRVFQGEQHIRKYKATSNICSNHGLNALAFTVYLSIVGENGLRKLSNICIQRAHYLSEKISGLKNFKIRFGAKFFNEFVIQSDMDSEKLLKALSGYGILGGINMERYFPELKGSVLVTVTEKNSTKDCERYLETLDTISNGGEL